LPEAQERGSSSAGYPISSIHSLVEAPLKYSPTIICQYFKGISSRKLREEFHDVIGQFIWKEGTLWARGCCIASVADKITTEVIREYIVNQKSEEKGIGQGNVLGQIQKTLL
jgi:REP element-mobilizing transposase RayT